MLKKQKIVLFLAVSLISLSFLLGYGKEAKGAYTTSENCYWIYYGTLYKCNIDPGGQWCLPGGGFGYRDCSDNATCWGNGDTAYAAVYYNSCTGGGWCSNVPDPGAGTKTICHYIYHWSCTEGPYWTNVSGSSCWDVGAPNCCSPSCGDTNSQCSGTPYGDGCGGTCWGTACCGGCGDPATVCSGTSYGDGCGGTCWGTKNCCVSNCNDSGNYCSGTTYTGNCGQSCVGTDTGDCNEVSTHCPGVVYNDSCGNPTCINGTLPQTCGDWSECSKGCGGGTQTKTCVCPPENETQGCSAQPCPPGYRDVVPW